MSQDSRILKNEITAPVQIYFNVFAAGLEGCRISSYPLVGRSSKRFTLSYFNISRASLTLLLLTPVGGRPVLADPVRPIDMQFYCQDMTLANSTAIIPMIKNDLFPLLSRRLNNRDTAVVYLEAHQVRTNHNRPVVCLTCCSQEFFRFREWDTFPRKA